ncbi:uncharacterized protein LOC112572066, partial [Pomacea canaliculata]|uniref:uncharacterized protein LOC112572066 n=1 Tax=Pomacea canaliculata TaxID=400727 RepID=UPI000D73DE75
PGGESRRRRAFWDYPPATAPGSNIEAKVETKVTSHPVYFDCRSGEAVVVPGDIAGVDSSGTYVIATRKIPERWRDMERPLRAREMKLLKIFSIVAVFLFFPTGVAAVIFAWRTRREFDEGLKRGNIDGALKVARRTKALIILSGVLAITTGVLVYSLVERAAQGYKVDTGYLAHSSAGG